MGGGPRGGVGDGGLPMGLSHSALCGPHTSTLPYFPSATRLPSFQPASTLHPGGAEEVIPPMYLVQLNPNPCAAPNPAPASFLGPKPCSTLPGQVPLYLRHYCRQAPSSPLPSSPQPYRHHLRPRGCHLPEGGRLMPQQLLLQLPRRRHRWRLPARRSASVRRTMRPLATRWQPSSSALRRRTRRYV